MEDIPSNIFYIIAGIFVAIFIGVFILLLLARSGSKTIEPAAFNPYCPIIHCGGNEDPTYVESVNGGYVTTNYCSMNAPSPDFIRSVQRCALNAGKERTYYQTGDRLKEYKEWYTGTYIKNCGKNWDMTDSHTALMNDIDACIDA